MCAAHRSSFVADNARAFFKEIEGAGSRNEPSAKKKRITSRVKKINEKRRVREYCPARVQKENVKFDEIIRRLALIPVPKARISFANGLQEPSFFFLS